MRGLRLGFAVPLWIAVVVLAASGCGKKVPTYPVKGTVTWKRKPPEQLVVLTFWREQPGRETDVPGGSAATDESGEFSLECEKGKYKITIRRADATAEPMDLKALKPGELDEALMKVYNDRKTTPLSVEVTEKGVDNLDVILRSPDEPPPPE